MAAETRRTANRDRRGRAAVKRQFSSLATLTVTYVAVDAITPNPYNPNRQSDSEFEQLLRSIEDHGFTQPIMVRRDNNEIVDGEHRWRAARTLGMTQVPIVHVDYDDIQARIATLGMNRARGSEEVALTAALLRDLQQLGALPVVQDSLLVSDQELRFLIDNVSAPDLFAADDFTPAWEPVRSTTDHDSRDASASHTASGADAVRLREAALAAAWTEQERAQAREEHRVYRLALVFGDDEADVVRAVLGDRPAPALVDLCRRELARREATAVR